MKNMLLSVLLLAGFSHQIIAQGSEKNLSSLLADGYSIKELEDIYTSISYDNYKKWLKKNDFQFSQAFASGLEEFKKNEVVSLGLFVKKNTATIPEIFFQSSPQKFYRAQATLDEDASYKKLAEKNNIKKWSRNGFIFYVREDDYVIGIYKDLNNEASATANNSGTGNATRPVTTASTAVTPRKDDPTRYPFNDLQQFADSLNSNMVYAYLYAAATGSTYQYKVLGKIDFTKSSLAFVVNNGELYIKMNIPMDGDCDYGLKLVKPKFINNCTLGMDRLCVKFEYEYNCNGKFNKDLTIAFPRRGQDYLKEDLFHSIVAKFRSCCKN